MNFLWIFGGGELADQSHMGITCESTALPAIPIIELICNQWQSMLVRSVVLQSGEVWGSGQGFRVWGNTNPSRGTLREGASGGVGLIFCFQALFWRCSLLSKGE